MIIIWISLPLKKNLSLLANMFSRGMFSSRAMGPMMPRNPPDTKYIGTPLR